ncbi:hypothetical protein B0T11DRAFT_58270 [Plectosphaerella cucumerina]|uniref:Uncharacterized protein n=1 Tax=Plectosphaerella cucumerina TaxID=40658 RepID=A0A8K0X617_9PEZI|nr:hypothetical protein B0T11DRAFT_58270 [Plectosphaerella cucumerina]
MADALTVANSSVVLASSRTARGGTTQVDPGHSGDTPCCPATTCPTRHIVHRVLACEFPCTTRSSDLKIVGVHLKSRLVELRHSSTCDYLGLNHVLPGTCPHNGGDISTTCTRSSWEAYVDTRSTTASEPIHVGTRRHSSAVVVQKKLEWHHYDWENECSSRRPSKNTRHREPRSAARRTSKR